MALDGRLIHTRAGIAAAAARRWEQAEHHYQAALQLAEALPSRIEQADLRRLQAVARVQARAGGVGTEDEPR